MTRPSFYEGEKKRTRSIRITDTAWDGLQVFADSLGVSVAELLERIGRRSIPEPEYRKFVREVLTK